MKITHSLMFVALLSVLSLSSCAAKKKSNPYIDWANAIAKSEMKHNPKLWQADFVKKPKWGYTQGLVAKSLILMYEETKDSSYYNYVKEFSDFFINEAGEIKTYKQELYNIDHINGGKFLFDMYHLTKEDKYLKAIKTLRSHLDTHPRTKVGVFWHKKVYPHQVWLDGLYMASPFYAQCADELKESEASFDDVTKQLLIADSVTFDSKTKLNFHGWDESREQSWSDSITGHSPNFWGRSMGWYMMAMVDVLDYLPKDHKDRKQIIANLKRLTDALVTFQDPETKMWYQVTDQPNREGNYVESSASVMYIYAIAKAVNNKYLPDSYKALACESFDGLVKNATVKNEDGTVSITKACSVAGLGGDKKYRDGSFEYYISEPIRNDDPKVVGPFIMAALELSKLCK